MQQAYIRHAVTGINAAVVGLLLVWLTARGVTRPILAVAARLEDIASGEGDLTRRLEYAKQDELGELAGWFNRFLDKLQPIIADVKSSVLDARSTADQSAAIASQTSAGMQQQFREVDQVATASQEMSATAHDVANNAAQAADAMAKPEEAEARLQAWSAVFEGVMKDAPWAPVFNEQRFTMKSPRMGGADALYTDPVSIPINYDYVYVTDVQ